jgi:peptidoglycan/LPS O-acetylase OafA/YrhL
MLNSRRRSSAPETWPAAAMVLYPLGLLAALAVALVLGGDETEPSWWLLTAVPLGLLAAASLFVKRAQRAR